MNSETQGLLDSICLYLWSC